MNRPQLLEQAKNIILQIKKEERKSVNPYASFAAQVGALVQDDQLKNRDDIQRFTRLSYSRPRMNRQWHTFGRVLEKNLRPDMNKETLLYIFGSLKRLLTIEGKKEQEAGQKFKPKGQYDQKPQQHRHQGKRRY